MRISLSKGRNKTNVRSASRSKPSLALHHPYMDEFTTFLRRRTCTTWTYIHTLPDPTRRWPCITHTWMNLRRRTYTTWMYIYTLPDPTRRWPCITHTWMNLRRRTYTTWMYIHTLPDPTARWPCITHTCIRRRTYIT